MTRLFTAIALPPAIAQSLAELQPKPAPGIRLVAPDQMHLTLHFIGEADIGQVADTLKPLEIRPFELVVAGVGQFSQGAVLWAGVQPASALLDLHAAIGHALVHAGIVIEARPYKPHITLAKCKTAKPHYPRRNLDGFLERNASLRLPSVAVTRFALYSSHSSGSGPVYRVEKWFPA